MKINFSGKDRNKYILLIIIAFAALIALICIYILYSNSTSQDKDIIEVKAPPILNSKDSLTTKDMIEAQGIGNTPQGETTDNSPAINENTFMPPNPESSSNAGANSKSSNNTASTPSNAHNVYGDYDMWQNREPAGSKIGYTEKKWKQPLPQEKNEDFTPSAQNNASYPKEEQYNIPSYSVKEDKNPFEGKQISAYLSTSGYIVDGGMLNIVLNEPAVIAGHEVKKGQAIRGTVREENGRLMVDVRVIRIDKKLYPVKNVKIFSEDGIEGIYLSKRKERSNIGEATEDAARNGASSVVSNIPLVGGVLGSAISSRKNRRSSQEPIKLISGIPLIVIIE